MRRVILDAEFDGLNPSRIWCIVCKDIDDGEILLFRFDNDGACSSFRSFCRDVSCWIGHNLISYDLPHLSRLLNVHIDWKKCIDTLIVSRLINYHKPGGHSVENWSKQFGLHKKEIPVYDDPNLIDDYVERCKSDVEIQYRIYKELERFIKDPSWRRALRAEHDVQHICHQMHVNGFAFNKEEADHLLSVINDEMAEIEEQIKQDVPPVLVKSTPITLRRNKDGSISKRTLQNVGCPCNVVAGSTWHRFVYQPFNPGSSKQRIDYLNSIGWQPIDKTKGHIQCERDLKHARSEDERRKLEQRLENFRRYGWRCNESNLSTLPADAPRGARLLAKWLTLEGRRGDLEEWNAAFNPATGRIHGSFNGIGAWTHRMSHVRPNKGNIFRNFTVDQCKSDPPSGVEEVKLKYNGVLRSLWQAAPGRLLVGTDAEGIQMRIFAHYIAKYTGDTLLAELLSKGRKEDKTDVHNHNLREWSPVANSRDQCKTLIYAIVLGASGNRIQQELGSSKDKAKWLLDKTFDMYPGIKVMREKIVPADAKRGWFEGVDGRKVIQHSAHKIPAGYLQNGESVVMKNANRKWRHWVEQEDLPYWQIDFVHDEWVTETEEDIEIACRIGELQAQSIVETGQELNLQCELAGEYKIGKDWLSVH